MRDTIYEALSTAQVLVRDLRKIEEKVSFVDFQALVPKIQRGGSYLNSLIQDATLDLDLPEDDRVWFEEVFFPVLRPWLQTIDNLTDYFIKDDYRPESDSRQATSIIQPLEIVVRALTQAKDRLITEAIHLTDVNEALHDALTALNGEDVREEELKEAFTTAVNLMQAWMEQN